MGPLADRAGVKRKPVAAASAASENGVCPSTTRASSTLPSAATSSSSRTSCSPEARSGYSTWSLETG